MTKYDTYTYRDAERVRKAIARAMTKLANDIEAE